MKKGIILKNPLNIEYLSKITENIFKSTGLRVAFRDPSNKPLYFENYIKNIWHTEFCNLIWSSPLGIQRCNNSDWNGTLKSLNEKKPVMYECHAGIIDMANAVMFGDKHICTILTGEILIEPINKNDIDRIRNLNKDLGIDLDKLGEAYRKVKIISREELKATEEFVRFFTDYLIQSQMLIEEVRKENELELLLKEANIKEILSKLNPHFIFNTLNIIPWFIRFQKYDDAIDVVYSLSKLLRQSFSKEYRGKKALLENEINLIKLYLKIQKHRFGSRLGYKFDLDKKTLRKKMPRLVLQSIIENCITHGFNESASLNIIVKSYIDNNYLMVEVTDNGYGIAQDKIDKIINIKKSKNGRGRISSLMNINRLIKLEYGENCGLRIISGENKGTQVIVKLTS